ncbi:MAG: 2-polyprenylphenol 6-hydroxylase [Rhizobiales bacterium]|nr:2-polyprenylphenol 6-hydroxylase [Hyphomicrobiales bacterium]
MAGSLIDYLRLARAGLTLARYGVRLVPAGTPVPVVLRLGRVVGLVWRMVSWPWSRDPKGQSPIAAALTDLGPSYIKLGQFFASRPDLIPEALVADLEELTDRLPAFPERVARATIGEALGRPVEALFTRLGPPVAAASIAQVHKGEVPVAPRPDAEADSSTTNENSGRAVAVKVLRPGIERRFANDLSSFYTAARLIERFHPPSRRLRPVAVVDTLAHTTALEMDLRLEAAAMSEMALNSKDDPGFRVPKVDWQRTAKRVLTSEWIDGTPIADTPALRAAGHDLDELGVRLIRIFLQHAMRDGLFHADMHPGNLFVDGNGDIVAIDFGIMGRLGPRERRFLAEILYGFISSDFRRAAEVHFWAGYVPAHHSVDEFAQALRAVAEPIMDRPAEQISMGHLLGQLFEYTEVFDMRTRPELILLQKTMVVVEGVARSLNPRLNMWTAGEPVVKAWMERELGAAGRIAEIQRGAGEIGGFLSTVPRLLGQAERTVEALASRAAEIAVGEERNAAREPAPIGVGGWLTRIAIWIGAAALTAIAFMLAARG